jgi:hypothetical protein
VKFLTRTLLRGTFAGAIIAVEVGSVGRENTQKDTKGVAKLAQRVRAALEPGEAEKVVGSVQ